MTVRSLKFRTAKVTVQAAGSATHSPVWGHACLAVRHLSVPSWLAAGPAAGRSVASDAVDLDAIWPGQQRRILAGRQPGGHDRTLGGVQGVHRRSKGDDDGTKVARDQHVDAYQPAEAADRRPYPPPPGQIRRGGLLWGARAVEVQQPGIGRRLRRGQAFLGVR